MNQRNFECQRKD